MRLIDADALINKMYHDAFETDTDMQKWDSGCWIRYKMFENAIDEQPTIGEMQMALDNEVMKAVCNVGIDVNKEELLKALELSESLVRCAECKFKTLYDGETKYYYCALEDRPNRNWSVDDWNFCYWGEKKESE